MIKNSVINSFNNVAFARPMSLNHSYPASHANLFTLMYKADEHTDEKEWWRRLRSGDQAALAYFYERYADWLLKYGLSIVYNRDLVRDALQELFIGIWDRRQTLSEPNTVKYYLMASLRRRILGDLRAERVTTEQFPDELNSTDFGFEDEQALHVRNVNLQQALRTLPPRQQELLFMRFFEGMSYEDITQITGLDNQVLRNTIHRAIKSLRLTLAGRIEWMLPYTLLAWGYLESLCIG